MGQDLRTKWFTLCLCLVAQRADAFTIFSPAAPGCHEQITSAVLRRIRQDVPSVVAIVPDRELSALIADLEFSPEADMRDMAGATLLIGLRDNDIKGRSSSDLTELAEIQSDPKSQHEHCLRGPTDLEPTGSQSALQTCREFILQRVNEALDGLDEQSLPDESIKTSLAVTLALRGRVEVPLPTYYLKMGQALHTLQDGFAHTYRSADVIEVATVLTWIPLVDGSLKVDRDGPPHQLALDRCTGIDADPRQQKRVELATQASIKLLTITLDSSLTREEKVRQTEQLLEASLTLQEGCTFDNGWCQSPDAAPQSAAKSGCSATESSEASNLSLLAVAIVLGIAFRRRHTARAVGLTVLLLFVAVHSVHAQEVVLPPSSETVVNLPHAPEHVRFGIAANAAASFDKPAVSGALGLRIRINPHWAFGVDGEWNPWISRAGSPIRVSTLNFFGTAIFRIPLKYESISLRTTAHVGTSILLNDLYSANSGSVGLFLGLYPLGIEWCVHKNVFLLLNPAGITVVAPQLRGVPLVYYQYRVSLGVEIATN